MKVLFNEKVTKHYDQWYDTQKGSLSHRVEKELMLRIADLKADKTILDVGCGTGTYLRFFSERGMRPLGIDVSLPMLRVARQKVGQEIGLCLAKAEALPFKDNSFDFVTFITTLEFLEEPLKALHEAGRISSEKILLGALNKFSLTGIMRRIRDLFCPSIYDEATFYTIWELKRLLSEVYKTCHIRWGSVLTFPLSLQKTFRTLERMLVFRKNPFGAYLFLEVSTQCANHEERGMPD
jgi:ubiquinone/menaquinone biosynthesis C-methylase UbiE